MCQSLPLACLNQNKRPSHPSRRANEATQLPRYLFLLSSSCLGRVTRANSPLVGSPSCGSVTLCRKLAPIPGRTRLPHCFPCCCRRHSRPSLHSPTHPAPKAQRTPRPVRPTRLFRVVPGAHGAAVQDTHARLLLHTYPLRMTWATLRTTTSCSGSLKCLFPCGALRRGGAGRRFGGLSSLNHAFFL